MDGTDRLDLIFDRETKQKTLEEIAAAFGDRVVEVSEQDVLMEGEALKEKADTAQIEKHIEKA